MNLLSITLMLGGFVALLVWQISSVCLNLPAAKRHHFDKPALGFILIWPLIRIVVFYIGDCLPDRHRLLVSQKLTKAGVGFTLSAEEFVAAQSISALMMASAAFVIFKSNVAVACTVAATVAVMGFLYPNVWLRDRTRRRQTEILKALPFYLDVITLAVESGSNLTGGMTQAVQKTSDSALRNEMSRALRDIRSGKPRADALRDFAERTASLEVGRIVTGMIQAEKSGANLGPLLRVQAEQLRKQRFQRAEKKAMEAPVKLLGPLFIFIFPTTFLTLGFVLISNAIINGVITWPPLVWVYQWPGAN
jgi:tight adherence protein C